jgi:integrating conjugative element protein (TIGR03749 family)
VPAGHAVEILRWERLPLAVPLVVGQERVVFIDRNVRIGVPAGVGEHLRVQSAGGAIYLRASEPIPPTRLQLQDVESGALILLDIAAEPAKAGQPALEPVRIVEGEAPGDYGDGRPPPARTTQGDARRRPRHARNAGGRRADALRGAEPLRAAAHRGAVAGIGRVNLRRDLALDTLLPTLPVRAQALAAWRLEDQWVTAVRSPTPPGAGSTSTRARCRATSRRDLPAPDLGRPGAADTTVVYLVTRGHGLAESLLPGSTDRRDGEPAAAAGGRPAEGGARHEK